MPQSTSRARARLGSCVLQNSHRISRNLGVCEAVVMKRLERLRRSLEEFVIGGIDTTLPLHRRIIAEPDFINGDYDIHWLEKFLENK